MPRCVGHCGTLNSLTDSGLFCGLGHCGTPRNIPIISTVPLYNLGCYYIRSSEQYTLLPGSLRNFLAIHFFCTPLQPGSLRNFFCTPLQPGPLRNFKQGIPYLFFSLCSLGHQGAKQCIILFFCSHFAQCSIPFTA